MTPLLIVLMSYEDWRYAFSGILIIENHNWNNHNDHHAQWWNIFFFIIIKENDTSLYWWWFFIEKIPEINKKIDKNQSNYRQKTWVFLIPFPLNLWEISLMWPKTNPKMNWKCDLQIDILIEPIRSSPKKSFVFSFF